MSIAAPVLYPNANPRRILITGGAGFIGSHLAEALLDRGHSVVVIDDLSTGKFENIAHLCQHPRFRFTMDSIMNEMVLDRLVSECDVIFHLAAAVGVKLIVDQPVRTIETNVNGTIAVLRAAVRYRAKVLIASTSEVYGKGNRVPFSEEDEVVLGPTSRSRWSYAASKIIAEFLALAYHREKGLPVVVMRLFNTIGPRQSGEYGMVVPRFIRQALAGEPITVYGNGNQTRCFLHVKDAIGAMIALADSSEALGNVYNIGSQEEISIKGLAELILSVIDELREQGRLAPPSTKQEQRIIFIPYDQAYALGFEDLMRRVPDITRIQKTIGWSPQTCLRDTILDIVTQEFLSQR
ncbi:MAG: GDP-mannose 4,6-dehydratase [Anaerolineales bacterium]|nr:GDP-mannose 4,6-dehydratase [Anaerolineales bacterium]MDW8447755.1 GDP-mannose 4,6-dehydratase [Anaerolineales bacterium]